MWRPAGWENPYGFVSGGAVPKYENQHRSFEEGADTMLKALLEAGYFQVDWSGGGYDIPKGKEKKGKLVFIPDEEDDNSNNSNG